MKLTGHGTESVDRRYAIVSEADLGVREGAIRDLLARYQAPLTAGTVVGWEAIVYRDFDQAVGALSRLLGHALETE